MTAGTAPASGFALTQAFEAQRRGDGGGKVASGLGAQGA